MQPKLLDKVWHQNKTYTVIARSYTTPMTYDIKNHVEIKRGVSEHELEEHAEE